MRIWIPFGVFSFLLCYLVWSLLWPLQTLPWVFGCASLVLALPFLSQGWMIFVFFRAQENDELVFEGFLRNFSYASMGVLSFLFTFSFLKDFVNFFGFLFLHHALIPTHPLTSAGIVGMTMVALLFGFVNARFRLKVVEVRVPVKDLPEVWQGLRMVHLSDLHFGSGPTLKQFKKVFQTVETLKPDLVAVTGDLIDNSIENIQPELKLLSTVRAPYGVYFCMGNHDHYWNSKKTLAAVKECGLRVLVNESLILESKKKEGVFLQLAGVEDPASRYFGGEGPKPPPLDPRAGLHIMLAHQPSTAKLIFPLGYDLQLSGHTHGGQFFPWNFVVKLIYPISGGLGKIGNMWLYVSHGTGFWGPPIRLGTQCEISVLTLVLRPTPKL